MTAWDARIARVDQPEPGFLCLTIRAHGRNHVLMLAMLPGGLGVGLVDERPRGASAIPAVSQLRRHVEGATIEGVEGSGRFLRVSLTRGGNDRFLICAPRKPYGAWWLTEAEGPIVVRSPGAPSAPWCEDEHFEKRDPDALRAASPKVLEAHRVARKRQLERLFAKRVRRLTRKRDAIRGDLERATQGDELYEKANLILAHLPEIPANSAFFETMTWGDDPRPIRIELDPRKSPAEFAQALFQKAKRLKRGWDQASERLEVVEAELQALTRLQEQLDRLAPDVLAEKLEALGVSSMEPKEEARKRRQAGGRLPYREFTAGDATSLLVGRNAADNDRLTLRVARPHHLWLHARGVTGAHVVIPLGKRKPCTPETLLDAATLAAHFSDLRGEAIVDVLYTPRRFVHKRKGSPAGSVTLDREKVIAVRIEPARLQRLLKSEKKAP